MTQSTAKGKHPRGKKTERKSSYPKNTMCEGGESKKHVGVEGTRYKKKPYQEGVSKREDAGRDEPRNFKLMGKWANPQPNNECHDAFKKK